MTDLRKLLDEARQWAADYRTGMSACDCDDDMCIHDEAMWRWRSIGKPDTFVLSMIGRVEPLAAALINAVEALEELASDPRDDSVCIGDGWDFYTDTINYSRAALSEIRALTGGDK